MSLLSYMCAFNPRKLRKMLRNLDLSNLKLEDVPNVVRVEFVLRDGTRMIIENPSIAKVSIGGLVIFQVQAQSSSIRHVSSTIQQVQQESILVSEPRKPYSDEDIELVIQETGCSREEAIKALEETKGDIAEAIMLLKNRKSSG